MIDENNIINKYFNNNKVFENKDDNNEYNDKQTNKIFQIKYDVIVNKIFIYFNDFFEFNF